MRDNDRGEESGVSEEKEQEQTSGERNDEGPEGRDETRDETDDETRDEKGEKEEDEVSAGAREIEEDPSRNPQDEVLKDIKGG